ncbi:Uncharacterised protein [Serratia marcescens]|nr:Uncharacterised protein [Serratia marcescens]CUZ80349.1 Uncharacterised protein [Serratia marcescens]CVA05933.1 Uncharacterised protein [Serratia marcescens]CVA28492.1 Uncharacterised protein [Serratia marcescens]CVG61655.1 Uncharacterised protein [Serratia marcescens]
MRSSVLAINHLHQQGEGNQSFRHQVHHSGIFCQTMRAEPVMLERGGGELPLKLVRIERDALPAAILQADGGDDGGVGLL